MPEIQILVVEDNSEDARTLEGFVRQLPYKYLFISDSRQIVPLLKSATFAVVLTELHMPHLNGIQVAQEVKRISPEISVVVMTAYSFIGFAIEAMEVGAYGYVTKPFHPLEVKIVLERAVQQYEASIAEDTKNYYIDLSVKDGLTGVFNRRCLNAELKKLVTEHQDTASGRFSMVIMDVDNFKKYNDTKGHVEGDKLLKDLSALVKESLREGDNVYRYGGEEFCIVLSRAGKNEAAMIAERVRTLVNLYLPATISMGVATFPDDAQTDEALIRKADTALYEAKHTGKNKVVVAVSEGGAPA